MCHPQPTQARPLALPSHCVLCCPQWPRAASTLVAVCRHNGQRMQCRLWHQHSSNICQDRAACDSPQQCEVKVLFCLLAKQRFQSSLKPLIRRNITCVHTQGQEHGRSSGGPSASCAQCTQQERQAVGFVAVSSAASAFQSSTHAVEQL